LTSRISNIIATIDPLRKKNDVKLKFITWNFNYNNANHPLIYEYGYVIHMWNTR